MMRRLALVLLTPMILAVPATADHGDSYRKGIAAWDKERWQDVARHMAAAVREQPRAGETIRLYGQRYEAYLPHLYLGLSREKEGDCVGALAALDESASQGAVAGRDLQRLDDVRAACQARLAKKQVIPPADPEPSAETSTTTDGRVADGTRIDPGTADRASEQVSKAESSSAESSSSEHPPLTLRRSAAAFLAGDYREALDTLDQFSSAAPKVAATAHLLRAAAFYSLYLEGGRRDEAQRRRAAEEARAWRSLDAGVTLPTSAFSPALLSFLRDPD